MVIGLAPFLVVGWLDRAVSAWAPGTTQTLESLVPLQWVSLAGGALALVFALATLLQRRWMRGAQTAVTWDCGYAAASPRIQYTGSSSSQTLVELFSWLLRPVRLAPKLTELFAKHLHYRSAVPDLVLDRGLIPASKYAGRILPWIRMLQQGRTQIYLLYILLTATLMLLLG